MRHRTWSTPRPSGRSSSSRRCPRYPGTGACGTAGLPREDDRVVRQLVTRGADHLERRGTRDRGHRPGRARDGDRHERRRTPRSRLEDVRGPCAASYALGRRTLELWLLERELLAGELLITNDLYERIVDVCRWPRSRAIRADRDGLPHERPTCFQHVQQLDPRRHHRIGTPAGDRSSVRASSVPRKWRKRSARRRGGRA